MPTTTITLTSFQTALAEAADYVAAGDYSSARAKLAVAGIILGGLPREAADSAQRIAYREDLTKVEALLAAAEASAAPSSTARSPFVRMLPLEP